MQRGRSTVYTLHAHLVFVTKYRRPVFTDEMLTCCEHLMADVCANLDGELREFNGETDHVHLLVHYPPSLAVSMLVNRLTGVSSRRLRQQYPTQIRKYLWESTSGRHPTSPPPAAALPDCHQAPHRTAEPTRLTKAARSAGRTNRIGFLPAVNGQASSEDHR